jgi:hypothetical protein
MGRSRLRAAANRDVANAKLQTASPNELEDIALGREF